MAAPSDSIGAALPVSEAGPIAAMDYFVLYEGVDFSLGAGPDHASSGAIELALGALQPGSNVTRAQVRVTGEAYHGKLQDFRGTRVTPSPLVYDASGAAAPAVSGQRAFVVDFGGVRTVLGLSVPASAAKIVLVLPWMGTDFGSRPAYPATGTLPFYALPKPDPGGKSSVGFPAIETAKLFVQIAGSGLTSETTFAAEARVYTNTLPSNVRAAVNGRPVFFTHPGPLDREVELAGLADELNTIAREAQGSVAVTVSVGTDTPGALITAFDAAADLGIERTAAARWGGRDTLEAPLAGLTPTPLELVFPTGDSASWQVSRIALELGGVFPRWRVFEADGPPPGRLALRASPKFSVARRFAVPAPTVLHGLALLLGLPAGAAELRLEILADADGAPAEGEALATVDLALDAADGAPAWREALAATPLEIGAARALWAVLKGKSGTAEWVAGSESVPMPPATLYASEGSRWQRYPTRGGQSPAPCLRVLREALARENLPLVRCALAAGAGAPLERTADPSEDTPAQVEFALPSGQFVTAAPTGGAVVLGVTVTAATTGTLDVRRATAYFRT